MRGILPAPELPMWLLIEDTDALAFANDDFRHVLTTTEHHQLVAMTLPPGTVVEEETHHDADQYVRVVAGVADVSVGKEEARLHPRGAFLVPRGTPHSVRAAGNTPLRLLAFYAPPLFPSGTVDPTAPEVRAAGI